VHRGLARALDVDLQEIARLGLDLPIGPIRVDYGIPVVYDTWNGPPGKFNFNIGYQF
jgi:outer membrane protein assembly factor BamA